MPGRWRGRVFTRSDDDPPRCAGNLAFMTLVPPMSRKRRASTKGPWANPYSLGKRLGEPSNVGQASTHWASQYYVLCLLGV